MTPGPVPTGSFVFDLKLSNFLHVFLTTILDNIETINPLHILTSKVDLLDGMSINNLESNDLWLDILLRPLGSVYLDQFQEQVQSCLFTRYDSNFAEEYISRCSLARFNPLSQSHEETDPNFNTQISFDFDKNQVMYITSHKDVLSIHPVLFIGTWLDHLGTNGGDLVEIEQNQDQVPRKQRAYFTSRPASTRLPTPAQPPAPALTPAPAPAPQPSHDPDLSIHHLGERLPHSLVQPKHLPCPVIKYLLDIQLGSEEFSVSLQPLPLQIVDPLLLQPIPYTPHVGGELPVNVILDPLVSSNVGARQPRC